jgi:hypothetical protein
MHCVILLYRVVNWYLLAAEIDIENLNSGASIIMLYSEYWYPGIVVFFPLVAGIQPYEGTHSSLFYMKQLRCPVKAIRCLPSTPLLASPSSTCRASRFKKIYRSYGLFLQVGPRIWRHIYGCGNKGDSVLDRAVEFLHVLASSAHIAASRFDFTERSLKLCFVFQSCSSVMNLALSPGSYAQNIFLENETSHVTPLYFKFFLSLHWITSQVSTEADSVKFIIV